MMRSPLSSVENYLKNNAPQIVSGMALGTIKIDFSNTVVKHYEYISFWRRLGRFIGRIRF